MFEKINEIAALHSALGSVDADFQQDLKAFCGRTEISDHITQELLKNRVKRTFEMKCQIPSPRTELLSRDDSILWAETTYGHQNLTICKQFPIITLLSGALITIDCRDEFWPAACLIEDDPLFQDDMDAKDFEEELDHFSVSIDELVSGHLKGGEDYFWDLPEI